MNERVTWNLFGDRFAQEETIMICQSKKESNQCDVSIFGMKQVSRRFQSKVQRFQLNYHSTNPLSCNNVVVSTTIFLEIHMQLGRSHSSLLRPAPCRHLYYYSSTGYTSGNVSCVMLSSLVGKVKGRPAERMVCLTNWSTCTGLAINFMQLHEALLAKSGGHWNSFPSQGARQRNYKTRNKRILSDSLTSVGHRFMF